MLILEEDGIAKNISHRPRYESQKESLQFFHNIVGGQGLRQAQTHQLGIEGSVAIIRLLVKS